MFKRTALEEDSGIRLDIWLSRQPELCSRSEAHRWISQGAVQINGVLGTPDDRLKPDDNICWHVPSRPIVKLTHVSKNLPIVYEDEALLVIDKPPQLAMHPSAGHWEDSVIHRLLGMGKYLSSPYSHATKSVTTQHEVGTDTRPGIVHRLDKDTSGLVVVAKQLQVHQALAKQFQQHQSERKYIAVVVGTPDANSGKVIAPIGRHPQNRLKQAVRPDGRTAVTHWWVMERLGAFGLCRLRLETGRTHQVRVHLAHLGLPVAGDPLYGQARHRGLQLSKPVLQAVEKIGRQALHAAFLGFEHPQKQTWIRFHSPLPADITNLLSVLRSAHSSSRKSLTLSAGKSSLV